MNMIEVKDLTKTYFLGSVEVPALRGVSFQIERGEAVAIMGQSGSGKSTLMNVIGCLDLPTSGEYFLNGKNVAETSDDELAAIRNQKIGFVFQQFNLLPRMTVRRNVEMPLLYAGKKDGHGGALSQRAESILNAVGLGERMEHRPTELSGGQQQRVALARALVMNPRVLLLDEPLGALDQKLRKEMQIELKRIQGQVGITFIYVTHDQEEAMTMSDRICLMNGGSIEQLGEPSELYFRPRTLFVADFVGSAQLLIYVGGTLVLLIFGVMLTASAPFLKMKTSPGEGILAGVVGSFLLSLILYSAWSVNWEETGH